MDFKRTQAPGIILHDWGLVEYETARRQMDEIHEAAVRDGRNHLIFCSHPSVFTVGSDGGEWPVPTVPTDRGGSITCHSEGQLVTYFCFQAPRPALFYRRVLRAYEAFFAELLPAVRYDKNRPGFYVANRKIASLGFRYRRGVSLHGVALNVDVDLAFHSLVAPCNLEGISPTSLAAEGVNIAMEDGTSILLAKIMEAFNDPVQA